MNKPASLRNNLWGTDTDKFPVGLSVENNRWFRAGLEMCDGSHYPLRLPPPPEPKANDNDSHAAHSSDDDSHEEGPSRKKRRLSSRVVNVASLGVPLRRL